MNFNKQKSKQKKDTLSSPKLRRSSHLTLFFYKYALVVIIALIDLPEDKLYQRIQHYTGF